MSKNSRDYGPDVPADAEFPSSLRITSKPFDESKTDSVERLRAWQDGEEVPHVINFQDASRLQRVLTDRRLELVRSLMDEPADSIRNLSTRLERDVRQIHDDVSLLAEYGIVRFKQDGRAKKPYVPYETIRIEVKLTASKHPA
jgi:predicted transcriptional regulator